MGSNLQHNFITRENRIDEQLAINDRRNSKLEDTLERNKQLLERLERKVKDVVE